MARAKAAVVSVDGAHILAADTVVACGRRILPPRSVHLREPLGRPAVPNLILPPVLRSRRRARAAAMTGHGPSR